MEPRPEFLQELLLGVYIMNSLFCPTTSIIHRHNWYLFGILKPFPCPHAPMALNAPNPKCLIISVYPFVPALSPSCSRILPILEREFNGALTLLSPGPLPNPLLRPITLIPLFLHPAIMFLSEHHMLRSNSAFLFIALIASPLYLQAFLIVPALFDAGFVGADAICAVAESLVIPVVELGGD